MSWVAFFSQTGSEIYEVSRQLNKYPDLIICNKQNNLDSINPNLIGKSPIIFSSSKPSVDDYLQWTKEDDIITLHGWLRIVPGEVCAQRNMYNGHPGLITEYPELKGKDPQERAFQGKYKNAGCVIHEVVPEVDAGKILYEHVINIDGLTLDEVYSSLHTVSTNLWIDFLKEKFNGSH